MCVLCGEIHTQSIVNESESESEMNDDDDDDDILRERTYHSMEANEQDEVKLNSNATTQSRNIYYYH